MSSSDSESDPESQTEALLVEAAAFSRSSDDDLFDGEDNSDYDDKREDETNLNATEIFDQSAHEFFDSVSAACGDSPVKDLGDHDCLDPKSIQRAMHSVLVHFTTVNSHAKMWLAASERGANHVAGEFAKIAENLYEQGIHGVKSFSFGRIEPRLLKSKRLMEFRTMCEELIPQVLKILCPKYPAQALLFGLERLPQLSADLDRARNDPFLSVNELAKGMPVAQSATQTASSINIDPENPLAISVLAQYYNYHYYYCYDYYCHSLGWHQKRLRQYRNRKS